MAATLVLRTVKGTPLTNLEVDNNFSNLNTFGSLIDSNIGVLSALTTSSTSNIVFAVNSLVTKDTNINSNIGVLSALTTTANSNIVFAVNELKTASISAAVTSSNLRQFAATTSADLASVISDETGTGNVVFSTSPVLTTPSLGTPSDVVLTNATGTASNLTVGKVTITDETSSATTYYPMLSVGTSSGNSANVSSTKLFFTPSTGLLTSTDYNSSSDMTLKQDFTPIQNPLDIISQLTGFGFTWKDSKEKAYGLSAQEVEKVIPEIVKDRPDGTKGINYMNLTAFLIEAIKDLKQEITELKKHK